MNSIKTGSTVFRLKQTHVELISETVRQSFFQGGKEWLWQNPLRGHKYELKFIAVHIFQTKILDYSCLYSCYFTIFSFIWSKKILWSTNNSTRRFTRHNLFEENRHTLVKRCGRYFHQRKKEASPKLSLLTQIRVDIFALYFLQTTSRERSYC